MTRSHVSTLTDMNESDKEWGIIIQARTGSTRLPQKMILPFCNGKGIFELLLARLTTHFAKRLKIVVATTTATGDDIIANIASRSGAIPFRGSESDVLGRFIAAAEQNAISRIIRICADNPFLDMDSIDRLIETMDDNALTDYVTFAKSDGTPAMKTHYGFWAEAVKRTALERAAAMSDAPIYHEHVTNFIYTHPAHFKLELLPIPDVLDHNGRLRLTIDTKDDFEISSKIYHKLTESGKQITIDNVVHTVDEVPTCYAEMERQIKKNTK